MNIVFAHISPIRNSTFYDFNVKYGGAMNNC